jgi:hypothetical protein
MALNYQIQESVQTLAEGLEEYYRANAGKVPRPRDLPPESVALFRNHDMCHVIFGLGTTLDDEALVDTRTMLSCDVGIDRYMRYLSTDKQAKALFNKIGYLRSIWATVVATPRMCLALIELWHRKKRWPWEPPESYQGRTLSELRNEHGIRVI